MNEIVERVVCDTVELLAAMARDRVRPEDAMARLRELRGRHPDVGMELVWEEEAYDGYVHYDLLLRLADGETVSLGLCPARAVPWPLRGAHRWSEGELLRVNQTTLRVAQAVACLDFIWDEAPLATRLITVCLIQEELERAPVEITEAELQAGMDALRRTHRLYTAEETRSWMERRGLTQELLERLVSDNLAVARLRDRIAEGCVAPYFDDHRADFDAARIACVDFTDEASARRVHRRILSGELSFYDAAERGFLAGGGGPHFTTIQRCEGTLPAVFAAAPGDVVCAARPGGGYAIARVLSVVPARLDERTEAAIQHILFEQWLEERRRTARIQWFWGNAAGTSQAA